MKSLNHTLKATKADERIGIVDLFCGQTEDGKDFWCYISILPSKYLEFKTLQKENKEISMNKFGKIIASNWGKEPPEEVKQKMEELGAEHDFEEKLFDIINKNS